MAKPPERTGLAPANLRIEQPPEDHVDQPVEVQVNDDPEGSDREIRDDKGQLIRIEHPDGTITISADGAPIPTEEEDTNPPSWFDNLAPKIDAMQLGIIADRLLRGIADDLTSRADWISQRAEGLKMLALTVETPDTGDSADGAAVEGTSKVRHPLMLEAVLKFHANAIGEFLPVDGPVKIRDDDNNPTSERDEVADDLQRDLNHFLTVIDRNYYPSTDKMFLKLGFGGLAYKKVYFSPIYERPTSEYVDADSLIVNNNATSLADAKRITHRILMTPSLMKRMQILGIYLDIPLQTPSEPDVDPLKQEEARQQGISPGSMNPDDRDREVYECYCELDIIGFEHKFKGKATGLEVPYRVTIDVTSRQILAVVRDYDKETEELPIRRETFVEYILVPGFGYYPIGLLHILSNPTSAATAAWRVMLDNGIFSNFPGGLVAKAAGRQNSNINRVPPGAFVPIETNGMSIRDAVAQLPYSAQGMPALMTLTQDIVQQGQRVGSTSDQPVGEGKQEAPVGTTLALIEQASKIMLATHKRMHTSQSRELQLLAKCFKEYPESLKHLKMRSWDEDTFKRALEDNNLIPQADPNTASHIQRVMKVQALLQLAQANPGLYDPIALNRLAIRTLGYSNPEQYMAPPEAMGKPTPEAQQQQADAASKQATAMAKQILAQAQAQKIQSDIGLGQAKLQHQVENDTQNTQIKAASEQIKGGIAKQKVGLDTEKNLIAERIQLVDVAQNLAVHPEAAELVEPLIRPAWEDVNRRQGQYEKSRGLGAAQVDDGSAGS